MGAQAAEQGNLPLLSFGPLSRKERQHLGSGTSIKGRSLTSYPGSPVPVCPGFCAIQAQLWVALLTWALPPLHRAPGEGTLTPSPPGRAPRACSQEALSPLETR